MATALLIIDMQHAIRDPRWSAEGPRNNLQAEANIALLLQAWRAANAPVVHVRHEGLAADSTYRADGPGFAFLPDTAPRPQDWVLTKHAHSAFVGTRLDADLKAQGVSAIVVCGVITNNSVEATVRHGADLGFHVTLAEDACYTFAKNDGVRVWSAEEMHAMALANLRDEYALVARTADLI
jgi:nicotinamidase-related amidase